MLRAKNFYLSRFAILSACILFSAPSSFANSADRIDTTLPPAIEEIIALPEDKIDMGIAALTFAKEIYPIIDIQVESKQIDAIASQVKAATAGSTDPVYVHSQHRNLHLCWEKPLSR